MLYYRTRPYNPWRELEEMQREVNQLFNRLSGRRDNGHRRHAFNTDFPPISIWTSNDDVKVVAEVPGIEPDDFQVSVLGNTLTLSGERKPEELNEGAHYHRRERGYGKFIRTIELPVEVDSDRVEAIYRHGKLTLTLPKAEAMKPKQIPVKAS